MLSCNLLEQNVTISDLVEATLIWSLLRWADWNNCATPRNPTAEPPDSIDVVNRHAQTSAYGLKKLASER